MGSFRTRQFSNNAMDFGPAHRSDRNKRTEMRTKHCMDKHDGNTIFNKAILHCRCYQPVQSQSRIAGTEAGIQYRQNESKTISRVAHFLFEAIMFLYRLAKNIRQCHICVNPEVDSSNCVAHFRSAQME